ncbi:hypothetical protein [Nocardioides pelophilus]|uniref:hypothetical protein n=1 Tax=Nocardioides pelophilus TaxID=2172019 RepID=UPI00160457CE|nr:hypothetical protein [Nocardioides pelophilus]
MELLSLLRPAHERPRDGVLDDACTCHEDFHELGVHCPGFALRCAGEDPASLDSSPGT